MKKSFLGFTDKNINKITYLFYRGEYGAAPNTESL